MQGIKQAIFAVRANSPLMLKKLWCGCLLHDRVQVSWHNFWVPLYKGQSCVVAGDQGIE